MKQLSLIGLFALGACGMFGGGDEENGGGSTGGYPDPNRVCVQITEENKEQMTIELGRSCKVGDFLSKGAPSCSSTLEKCMTKKY